MPERFREILDDQMSTPIRGGPMLPQLLRDDFCFGTRLVEGYAGSQAGRDLHADPTGSGVAVFFIGVQDKRSEQVNVLIVGS